MQSYHWFTETIQELTNDAREADSDKLLLGLSLVIDTFVIEADLPLKDRARLCQLQSLAAKTMVSKGSESIQRLRASMT